MAYDLGSLFSGLGSSFNSGLDSLTDKYNSAPKPSDLASFGMSGNSGWLPAVGAGLGSLSSIFSGSSPGSGSSSGYGGSSSMPTTPTRFTTGDSNQNAGLYSALLNLPGAGSAGGYASSGNPYSGEGQNGYSQWQGVYGYAPRGMMQNMSNAAFNLPLQGLQDSYNAMSNLGNTIGSAFAGVNQMNMNAKQNQDVLDSQERMQAANLAFQREKMNGLAGALTAMLQGLGNKPGVGASGYGDTHSRQQFGLKS